MNLGGLAFRVCMYFTAQPKSALSATDIAERFHYADPRKVSGKLLPAVHAGYLTATGPRGRGYSRTYIAGPRLLGMLERAK